MTEEVRLEWQYTPPDYFEEPLSLELDQIRIDIADGCITAYLQAALYDRHSGIRDEIEEELENRFLAAQLINHKPYQILGLAEYRTNAEGREDVIIHAKAASAVAVAGRVDIRVTDADGNIVGDTKAERIAHRTRIADLVAKHAPNDPTLRSMLASYDRAVNDPHNELVRLYEVRDALKKRFSGEQAARQAIGVSSKRWSRLGRLANDEPLRQGRHRGQHSEDELRNATSEELSQARAIALEMIEGYLTYLESQG